MKAMNNLCLSSMFSLLAVGLALELSPAAPAVHAQESGTFQVPLTTVEAEKGKEKDVGYTSGVASSATRMPESILDTPRTVNVVPESVLEDRAIFDPQEAIQHVSGVQRGGNRTGVGESYVIRGFA